jgi:hypothetical protein
MPPSTDYYLNQEISYFSATPPILMLLTENVGQPTVRNDDLLLLESITAFGSRIVHIAQAKGEVKMNGIS